MSISVYNRFVSVLTLVAVAAVIALAVPSVRRRVRESGSGGVAAWLVVAVAAASTAGSLLYSEAYGLEPCRLCWYQRIAMYPLVLTGAVAAFRADLVAMRRYILPPAVVGALVAAYHYIIQLYPTVDTGACSAGVPCSARYVEEFGFVSIPFMALAGFALIVALIASAQEAR